MGILFVKLQKAQDFLELKL